MILDSLIQLALSMVNSIVTALITYFWPNYQSTTEQARHYVLYGLYALVGLMLLSCTFLINVLIGWCIHSAMISGLRLQHEGIEFEIDYFPTPGFDFEEDEKQSKSFFKHQNEDDDYYENYNEFVYETAKKSKWNKKNQCVQTARKNINVIDQTHYSAALVLTLPETHYERIQANTPLTVRHGAFTRTRPIPTPTRSSVLAITRTLMHLPLLLLGIVPETNEIEVNLWGGYSTPLIASVDEEFTFTIHSCKLQVLGAHLIITPHLSILERLLTRFPLLSILSLATVLQALTILFWSGLAIYFFHPSLLQSLFPSETAVHDLPVPKNLHRTDSWSQLDDDDEEEED